MDISFITASKDVDKQNGLRESLETIFGKYPPHEWELIVADGAERGSEGLCALYNWGAEQAKMDTFVFLHDDVRLLCHPGLFQAPYDLMKKPLTGIVGVAGTRVLPKDGVWWKAENEDCRGAVYHPSSNHFGMHLNCWPHMGAQFGQVAICDGVMLMCSRRTFKKLGGFDAEAYHGLYHMYDIDISFRAKKAGMSNWVSPIPVFHASPGQPDESYETARKIFIAKFGQYLPYELEK